MSRVRRGARPLDVARVAGGRGAAFLLLWWALTEGTGGFAVAAVVAPLAVWATFTLGPPHRGRLCVAGLLRFATFFLRQSLIGGLDVARRALDPRLPIAPGLYEYPVHLTAERARVLLANSLSLVPGTVSAELHANHIRLHVLDERLPIERTLRRLEASVAGIFCETLGETQNPDNRR